MKSQPTKEMLIKFARRHTLDIDGYYQDEKERDPHKREIDAIVRQLKAVRKQCESFRKQRDELINDMQNVKRKAEAFDEIKVNLYHVKDLKPWETLDPKDHEFLRDIFNEIPSDWETDH